MTKRIRKRERISRKFRSPVTSLRPADLHDFSSATDNYYSVTRRVHAIYIYRDLNLKNSLFQIASVVQREGNIRGVGEGRKIYIYRRGRKEEEKEKR